MVQLKCNFKKLHQKSTFVVKERNLFEISGEFAGQFEIIIMSYWDVESFLTQQQPAIFRFTEDAQGMAFLDSSKGISGSVPADSPLNAPIWIVTTLRDYVFKQQQELIRVEVPKFLQKEENQGYYKAVQLDRTAKLQSLNLRQKSPYFYHIYEALFKTIESNKNLLQLDLLRAMITARSSEIIERAAMHQPEAKAETKFNNYVQIERKLFRLIRSKSLEYEEWESKKKE